MFRVNLGNFVLCLTVPRMRLEKDTERLRQGILALESKLEGMATQLKDNEESNSHICSTSAKKVVIFDCVVCECKYFQA